MEFKTDRTNDVASNADSYLEKKQTVKKYSNSSNQPYHENSYATHSAPEFQAQKRSRGAQNQRFTQHLTAPPLNSSPVKTTNAQCDQYDGSEKSGNGQTASKIEQPSFVLSQNSESNMNAYSTSNQLGDDKKTTEFIKSFQSHSNPHPSPIKSNNLTTQKVTTLHQDDKNSQNFMEKENFTLSGLASIMKKQNPSTDLLYSGIDLTNLGLNFFSSKPLSTTFSGPFQKESDNKNFEYSIPASYLTPYRMSLDKIKLFGDETLLYIFYMCPKDVMQVWAAKILLSREWRYSKEQKIWYHKVKECGPLIVTPTYEKGSYVYMDVSTWKEVRVDDKILEYSKIEFINKNTDEARPKENFDREIKRLGIADRNIILMLADGIACNCRNIFAGCVLDTTHEDFHCVADIEIDYVGHEVNAENFLRVLVGRHEDSVPMSKRLLSDESSNILLYISGHSGEGFLKFKNNEELNSVEIGDSFTLMEKLGRYNEIMIIVDTCQGSTLYEHIESKNVFMISSSSEGENSYSHNYSPNLDISLIDKFTFYTGGFLSSIEPSHTTLVQDMLETYNSSLLRSNPYWKLSRFARSIDQIKIMDFFGSIKKTILITTS